MRKGYYGDSSAMLQITSAICRKGSVSGTRKNALGWLFVQANALWASSLYEFYY